MKTETRCTTISDHLTVVGKNSLRYDTTKYNCEVKIKLRDLKKVKQDNALNIL